MANYEANKMLVAVKAYTRGNPLSLDASETWESLSEAQTYAKSAIAYAGQTIKAKLEDGKYHQYILQQKINVVVLMLFVKQKVMETHQHSALSY